MNNKKFASLLKKYINNNQYTVVYLSKLTNIPRSTIQKYMSGNLLPTNYNNIEKIISFFPLTAYEKNELKNTYIIEKIGYPKFKKINILKRIIESLNNMDSEMIQYNISYNFKKINNFAKNPEELKLMVHYILEETIVTTKKLKILLNCNTNLFDIIYMYAKNNSELSLDILVNLKSLNNQASLFNLVQFEKLLKLSLLDNNISIRYVHGNETNFNYYSIFPYMVASDKKIILINSDYTLGILIDDNQKFLHDEYNKKRISAKKLITKGNKQEIDINRIFNDFINSKSPDHYIYSGKFLNYFNSIQNLKSNFTIYFKFNNEAINPTLIKELEESDNVAIHMINNQKFLFPDNLTIFSSQKSLIIIKDNIVINVLENTLCQDFLLLNNLFITNDYCFDQQTSINKINHLL